MSLQQIANAPLGTDYLFAKLHAEWSTRASPQILAKAIQRGEQGIADLFNLPSIRELSSSEVARFLEAQILESFARLLQWLDFGTAYYYRSFFDTAYLRNIAILLRLRGLSASAALARSLVVESAHVPRVEISALLSGKLWVDAALPPRLRARLQLLFKRFNADTLPHVLAAQVDRMAENIVAEAGTKLGPLYRPISQLLLALRADVYNLTVALRNVCELHCSSVELDALWLKSGTLAAPLLVRLSALGDLPAFCVALPPRFRQHLAADVHQGAAEDALWKCFFTECLSRFFDFSSPEGALVAYPFLKQLEVRNALSALEGLRAGVAAEEIPSLFLGGGRV